MTSHSWDWGEGYPVFLSHLAQVKEQVAGLKASLNSYGISAFVAHEDIAPSEEWQEEIRKALHTMRAFVALLTDGFYNSEWTDQEIGYALCRGVPIVAVRLGVDPRGFIGKLQGLPGGWSATPSGIVKILMDKDPVAIDYFVQAVERCENYDQANKLAELLPHIRSVTEDQASGLVKAFNSNLQVSGSYGFNGKGNFKYGSGLGAFLYKSTGREFQIRDDSIHELSSDNLN